jgi:hypothetical protein
MKRMFTVLAALLAILAFVAISRTPKVQLVSAAPMAAPAPAPEPHPEIRAAIHHLEEAKKNLEAGAHDFGGHRVKALEATNRALEECRAALEFDRH